MMSFLAAHHSPNKLERLAPDGYESDKHFCLCRFFTSEK